MHIWIMSNECRGFCFEQIGNGEGAGSSEYVKKASSKCKLQKCPKCKDEHPQELLDCCEGYCQNCAMEIFDIFEYVKEKLGIQELKGKKHLQKFADLIAEFLNQ